MFDRVLIANRGEIVVRIARTLRRLGCSAAAVHAPDDAGALHVRTCDVAVAIGSYLDAAAVVDAALRCGAQAIHPGYGFLSERAELARACEAAGLAWIGPPAEAIELMGDKVAAKGAAERAGVPVVPGLHRPALSDEEIRAFAAEAEPPLLVKAAAGGGGKGMRVVASLDELDGALAAARREAVAAFGDDGLLVERFVAPARHLEVQVLADRHGTVRHLGERECSLQRRHQKVLEEAPSPVVDAGLRERLGAEAVALARACGYVGAGTVEFVADADDPTRHYFLEMNTRLQVEHPVTEAVWGVDLVEWQVRVAAGERLALDRGAPAGHAVEARIYAEDPARGFLPATGTVRALALPAGVRVDSGIVEGDAVTTRYDPMLAKVVAHAATRDEALGRLRGALEDTTVLGLRTNVGFLRALAADADVRAGRMDTGLIERRAWASADERPTRPALVAALADALAVAAVADPFAALAGWRVSGTAASARRRFVVDGEHAVEVAVRPPLDDAAVELDGEPLAVAVVAFDGRRLTVAVDGEAATWTVARDGAAWWVGSGGRAWRVALGRRSSRVDAEHDSELRAPMPGAVIAVHVKQGEAVVRGDVLLVLESMKMELSITAPVDGTVTELRVAAGDQVGVDAALATVHPDEAAQAAG